MLFKKLQHVEYYTGGHDAAVQMNGMIAQGWEIKHIIAQTVSAATSASPMSEDSTVVQCGGFIVLFEKTEIQDPHWQEEINRIASLMQQQKQQDNDDKQQPITY